MDTRFKMIIAFVVSVILISFFGFRTPASANLINIYVEDRADPILRTAMETYVSLNSNSLKLVDAKNTPFNHPGKIVIFAHGTEEGLLLQGKMVNWKDIASMIDDSPANRIYLMACSSNNTVESLNSSSVSKFVGINGQIDAVVAACIPVILSPPSSQAFFTASSKMTSRLKNLSSGKEEAKFLGLDPPVVISPYPIYQTCSESGYQLAFRKEYKKKTIKIGWIKIKTYEENVLWINSVYECDYIIAQFKRTFGDEIGELVEFVLSEYCSIVEFLRSQRYCADTKFGIGAQIVPIPSIKFWYDFGNDGFGLDGQYSFEISNDFKFAIGMYAAFAILPSSWTPIIR